jgi:hypothetical protein
MIAAMVSISSFRVVSDAFFVGLQQALQAVEN